MKKTLLVLLLALALVLSFGTMALAAEVEVGTATDLQNAINDADAGDTIKLTANIETRRSMDPIEDTIKGYFSFFSSEVLSKTKMFYY